MASSVSPFLPLSRTTWRNSILGVLAGQLVTGPAEAGGLYLRALLARTVTKVSRLPGAPPWAGRGVQARRDGQEACRGWKRQSERPKGKFQEWSRRWLFKKLKTQSVPTNGEKWVSCLLVRHMGWNQGARGARPGPRPGTRRPCLPPPPPPAGWFCRQQCWFI